MKSSVRRGEKGLISFIEKVFILLDRHLEARHRLQTGLDSSGGQIWPVGRQVIITGLQELHPSQYK